MDPQNYIRMMERWSQTAKEITQMATAALLLPTFFLRTVLGVPDASPILPHLRWPYFLSWAALGCTILLGISYQITASRKIEEALVGTQNPNLFPHIQFRAAVAAFLIGIFSFILGVILS
ncbi:hypothetical protein [Sphingopyxis sp. PET50]|uniref:hypothetical protein n=1 Tax=Sphingopyxis sp. PET50 TaxID=2976533 RepID=UPI0021AFC9DD|nr:hypothetical protein [Sphingopyxis sp. PET50]